MGRQDQEQARDVRARQAWDDFAARIRGDTVEPCAIAEHRPGDARLPAASGRIVDPETGEPVDGPWTCQTCHPAAPALEPLLEHRADVE